MFIKPLYNLREFDIFLGEGWDNWVRVRMSGNRLNVIETNVENLEGNTVRLIYYKVKQYIKREKEE